MVFTMIFMLFSSIAGPYRRDEDDYFAGTPALPLPLLLPLAP
jgi:hypothetical protein